MLNVLCGVDDFSRQSGQRSTKHILVEVKPAVIDTPSNRSG